MATYKSIYHKAEEALAYAYANIPDGADAISGVTTYKASDAAEKVLPAVTFFADSSTTLAEEGGAVVGQNFIVSVEIHIETEGVDTSRTVHANIEGLVEAVFSRSAVQIVGSCNAASVSDFTALVWIPTGGRREYEDQRRKTIYTGLLTCASSALT